MLAEGTVLVDRRRWEHPLPDRFAFEADWLLKEMLEARRRRLRVSAFYHSHPPPGELRPSFQDRIGHPIGSKVLIMGAPRGRFEWRGYEAKVQSPTYPPEWEHWPLRTVRL